MSEETKKQEKIGKPWGVYHLVPSIVKIVKEVSWGVDVRGSEKENYFQLGHHNLTRFDTAYEAIEYLCKHHWYPEEKVIQTFLNNFPNERGNLEKFLARRQAKCTTTYTPFPTHIHTPEGIFDPEEKY